MLFFFSSYCIPFLRFEASTSNSWFSNESPVAFLSANIKYPQIPWPHTYMFYVKHGISIAFWHRLRQICGGFWHDDDCSLLHLDLIGASPWPCLRFSASCWASIGDDVVYFKYTGSLSVSRNCYMFISTDWNLECAPGFQVSLFRKLRMRRSPGRRPDS